MTLSGLEITREHPAFARLSDERRAQLSKAAEPVRFRPGQPLAESSLQPGQIFLILEGQARVIYRGQDRLESLARVGPGAFVGLASLLRADPCEDVIASSDVVALAIPDRMIVELWQQDPEFQRWAAATLQPAELADLLLRLLKENGTSAGALPYLLRQCLEQGLARLVPADNPELKPEEEAYIASHNTDLALGTKLDRAGGWPQPRAPFALRVIALDQRITLWQPLSEPPAGDPSRTEERSSLPEAPNLERGSLDLGQSSLGSRLKLVRGIGAKDGTMAAFQMLAQLLKLPYRRDAIEKAVVDVLQRGHAPSLQMFGQMAANLGVHVIGTTVPLSEAGRLRVPSVVTWKSSFALVVGSHQNGVELMSPEDGRLLLTPDELSEHFEAGISLLVMERNEQTKQARFDLGWFLPALRQHRSALTQVLVASFVVQLLTLANPLLIQVIIDKVINQRSLATLQVLGIALVVVTLLESVLTALRTYLFTETTNRIDMRLGGEVIDHLLRLPLNYFDRRQVGELSSRLGEMEKIRNFLTGQALTVILDAVFAVVYIGVMVVYSWALSLVALAVVPIQVGLTFFGAPLFRRQFRKSAEENARAQSHLVEVLSGIQTVKAQNVEMVSRWKWHERYEAYISKTFEKTITGTTLNEMSQVLQKLSQLLVLWVGAGMVLKGELTLGQLIAFRIISGYVTQPLLRLSTLWQNVQELRVSFERLADVVDTPQESTEVDRTKTPLPPVQGRVTFEGVTFGFRAGSPVLKNVSLDIAPGRFVGVVGQSGSGKSTLMKLLSRLYKPDEGRVLIDGNDIDKVELYSLRRQIGIVPQDPLLFSGTIAENIALADPEATNEAIVNAAQTACAHEFVMQLPDGYSTEVGERGAALSGGQRQRIAIARTLLANPKLLIMDEATSALDYDTERRVCQQLSESLKGCTVFFITHRLSTIRGADEILMMDQGCIVERGSHDQLMGERGRYYALYRQQEASS